MGQTARGHRHFLWVLQQVQQILGPPATGSNTRQSHIHPLVLQLAQFLLYLKPIASTSSKIEFVGLRNPFQIFLCISAGISIGDDKAHCCQRRDAAHKARASIISDTVKIDAVGVSLESLACEEVDSLVSVVPAWM